ncbi:uncharacterized protein LOC111372351 [Olea europaea var. sylvestris]|uniref:uncharacterized protein LOC111372351 n=1 Tax=Olea europaea var. sylvestris TaxID=158386 RepID=UPI000C1CD5A8|nr:uncharacterized protein LOC111372351 [Olea europaea var. sylvestris]
MVRSMMNTWGCPVHVLKEKTDKMESRSNVCFFVGYPKGTRGYYFYNPLGEKLLMKQVMPTGPHRQIEPEVVENEAPIVVFAHVPTNRDIEDVVPNQGQDQIVGREEGPLVRLDNQTPPTITRSGRVVRPPSRYLLYGESYQVISTEQEEDLTSFKEVMEDVDFES